MGRVIRNSALIVLLSLAGAATAVEKINVVGLFKDTAIVVIDGTRRLLRSGDTSPPTSRR